MNYEDYSENPDECMYDFYGTEEEFEKVNQFLTLDEIEHLMKIRLHVDYDPEDKELLFDKQKGLYYTDRLFACSAELLTNHMLVEKCMRKRDQIDWQRTTHNYDYEVIAFIRHTFNNPLRWDTPEHNNNVICLGLVVAEGYREFQPYGIDNFWDKLYNDALLWFADNMPTIKDAPDGFRYYQMPNDFIAWDRLFSTKAAFYHRYGSKRRELIIPDLFNIQTFRDNISYIAQERGGAKAARIVRLLREDWQDILLFKYFNIADIPQHRVEEFRQCLFAGMDRNLRKWDAETPKVEDPKPAKKKPAQQDRTYITFTMSGITVGHIDLLRQKLIQVGWIAKDTLPDDFYKLFSGKTNSAKITWTGAVGKGMLLFLFQKMVDQGEIVVPDNHSIATILESHFVNEHGKYISGLNSSKESPKHFPIVKECLNILQLEVDND